MSVGETLEHAWNVLHQCMILNLVLKHIFHRIVYSSDPRGFILLVKVFQFIFMTNTTTTRT